MRHFFLAALLTACAFSATPTRLQAQVYQGRKIVEASLIADTTAIVPGQPFRLGLRLRIEPGWHVYWKNPGDSGIATTPGWNLPERFQVGPLQWPMPLRLVEVGDISVYAYHDETLLMAEVTPPDNLTDSKVTLRADPKWLVCHEICIPGASKLELTLPVASASEPAHAELFAKFQAELPSASPPPFGATWTRTPAGWNLALRGVDGASQADFFPYANETVPVGITEPHPVSDGMVDLAVPVEGSPPVEGVLVLQNGQRRGWVLSSGQNTAPPPPPPVVAAPAPRPAGGFAGFLLLAFLGGFILNLMPCVLPVISLKIFGFMRQAGGSRSKILSHGLAFAAGIFVWFFALAAVIIALKTAGHEATWAFQFQNPWFNFVIGAVVFVFALNLFGVFEIVLPGRAAQGIAEAGSHGGLAGSFAQGILATLLATPCTAPFLGTALGFAFSQGNGIILAIFAAVATGMAFPYILLSAQPGWMKFLPKPGAWMERLKQFMGFPLLATLLWLLYVIGHQRGVEAVIWAGAAYLCLALAVWLYGSFLGPLASVRAKIFATLGILLSLLLGLGYFAGNLFAGSTIPVAGRKTNLQPGAGIPWVTYSEAELQRLLAEGKPVFLDFTADWCLTCQFNLRTAIDTPAVRAAMAERGIVPMLADWTNSNPEITRKLAQFDRVGVPFYLFYPPGKSDQPVILPELLTEKIMLRTLGVVEP